MARFTQLLTLCALVLACAADVNELGRLAKRQIDEAPALVPATLVPFPPQLNEQESVIVNSFRPASVASSSYYYTHGLHLAGTNKSMAQWTATRWAENGFKSRLIEYYVYINYPVSQSLSLEFANGTSIDFNLNEAIIAEDPTTSYPNRVPSFHGYSASGNVSAPYIYVGRGERADFQTLMDLGIDLKGKIALARYGGSFRGLKVKNAQEHGMIGCVIFTDPADDGNVNSDNGYAAYPDGPAREPTSVQRGSVQFLSTYPGDPTTPGYPSHDGVSRADSFSVTPRIPSLPLSMKNAQPLLAALDEFGKHSGNVSRPNWSGGLKASYDTGPNPEAVLTLSNQMDDKYTRIWDAVGIINGTSEDEVIIIGNHYDAWVVGGAADPNSGSAIMIELSKALSALRKTGWRPRRTVVLASWDMEEYGLVGSTEFVEEHLSWLSKAVVSYVNIDVGCSGPIPEVFATPELHSLLEDVMKKVIYPDYSDHVNQTMYDAWKALSGDFGVLGSGSDFAAFLHNGIGAVDMSARNGKSNPVYHYHSNFDSYAWMEKYGDPGFKVHVAMGQFLGLLTYHLATDTIIPFDVTTYSQSLQDYFGDLDALVEDSPCCKSWQLDLDPLQAALDEFSSAADTITEFREQASKDGDTVIIDWINQKYRDFQRGFVSQGGLPGREFYKHVVFAPGVDNGYAATTFPGITEAVQGGNLTLAKEWVDKTSRAVGAAAKLLAL